VVSLQTPYSMLQREFELDLAPAARGLGVLAYETLCRGLLAGAYTAHPPEFDEDDQRSWDPRFTGAPWRRAAALVSALSHLARARDLSVAALPIGWVLTRPGLTAAIVGARSAAQVEQNVRAADLVGDASLWEEVDDLVHRHGE
jgi:aryl-alcohol dehydrogenase-like predicted oxidoreductase